MNDSKIKGSSALEEDVSALIDQLRKEYDNADQLCREVADFRDEAGVPAINEMRYAGYHLLMSVSDEPDGTSKEFEHLKDAVRHCRRAAYEASEAGILSAIEFISIFKEEYKSVTIIDIIPDWIKILKRCDEIQDRVSAARDTGRDRSTDHEAHMNAFRELRDFCRTTEYSREELNKKIQQQIVQTRNFFIGTLIGLIALVAAIVFGALPFWLEK
ncbi:MAG: hypothetical protein P1U83_00370 [Roseovarius sp.]|nr:hypothetical protein [Roseovarius sp.]